MAAHTSSKQPVNLTINHAVLMEARKYKINISHALEKALAELNKQRVLQLERVAELERFQKLTVGRELKMIELKKEIENLKKR